MKALVWHGRRDVRVDQVPDPEMQEPTDAIVCITTTAVCGSDLHLYEVLAPFLESGDILGHEPMGIVEEIGSEVRHIKPGDRVVIPFNKQVQLRMGQANVRRWIDDLMPLVTDDADPLGVGDLATHHLPLEDAPHGYEIFQKKQDGAIKVLLHP